MREHSERKLDYIRSSRPKVFCKKSVLKNFTGSSQENICASVSFLNQVTGLRPATLLKKRLWLMCFPANFEKFLRKPFFIEHLWWLLLDFNSLQFLRLYFIFLFENISFLIEFDSPLEHLYTSIISFWLFLVWKMALLLIFTSSLNVFIVVMYQLQYYLMYFTNWISSR